MRLKTILPLSRQYPTSGNKPILFPNVFSILESVVLPRHEDFEKIYQNFIDQYGEEGEQKYFAWLNEHGYDDTKPMPKKESFSWVGDIQAVPGSKNLIRGEALHPLKTLHPEEWPGVRVYLEEELQKSAHTLADKPLLLDHSMLLDGKVTGAQYEDGAIEYAAQLNDPRILDLIRTGDIKHCSVEFEWESLEHVNGVAPKGIKFTALSLLKNFAPGDPLSTVELVEVWEGIVQHLKEAKMKERSLNRPKNSKTSAPAIPGIQPANGETGELKMSKEKRPQTLEGRVTFLETSKLLKEQKLSKEEVEAKINELTQQRLELENELQQIAEEEQPRRDEIWQQMDLIAAQLCAYEEALAALIAGTAAPPEGRDAEEGRLKEQDDLEPEKDEHGCVIGKERYDEEHGKCVPIETAEQQGNQEPPKAGEPKTDKQRFMDHYGLTDEQMDSVLEWIGEDVYKLLPEAGTKRAAEKKKGLDEAILGAGDPQQPTFVVPVEKLEAKMPSLQAERSMSYGAQRFVQDIKGLIRAAKEAA
jgi:hypothetical protein